MHWNPFAIISISLVNDVFSKDNEGKVPMDKVMILIWLFRDDPTVVQFMAHFVTKVSNDSSMKTSFFILYRLNQKH